MEKKTIIDLFESSVKRFPGNPFLWEKTGKRFEPTTYSKVRDLVYEEGAGLISLGVRKGDNMALLSEGRNAWIIGELAMFYAGATNVPLSIKLEEANDLLFRLVHADVKYIMVSGLQLKKIRAIKDKLPAVRKIIVLDELAEYQDREMSLSEIRRMGKVYLGIHPLEEFLAIGQSLGNDDYATITYTSGTTADPKGVILTHRNYTANVEQALTCVDIDDTWRTLVILPLDHCFAHVVGFYIFMSKGASVATVQVGRTGMETLKNIPINIKEFKPYLILSVPALAKNFKKNIEQGIRARGKNAVRLFNLALRIGYIYNGDSDEEEGKGFRVLLKPLVRLFDKLLFAKVRENFRGENVMAGYWKNPASTADTVKEGWLYTGDMGYMHDGLLYVLGRFKSLLIGSDGEKYSPEGIEEALVEHSSCIDQLILYNNQSPYTTALLVPNKERLRKHLAHQNLDLTSDQGREEAIRIIQRQIDRFRKGGDLSTLFPDRWLPTTFAILPEPFTEQNGMVNSTMKIVRGKVEKAYAARIAQLYTPEGKNPLNKWNKEAL